MYRNRTEIVPKWEISERFSYRKNHFEIHEMSAGSAFLLLSRGIDSISFQSKFKSIEEAKGYMR